MPRQVFTAGEILTAANMNDLADSTVMVFADSTARGSAIPSPSEGMTTYLKDTDSVEVFDGSDFVPVAIEPDPPAILQVVSTTKTDVFTMSSGTFAPITGLSATITPSSESSKILITAVLFGDQDGDTVVPQIQLLRDSTAISVGTSVGSRIPSTTFVGTRPAGRGGVGVANFLDSPATTSAVTYSFQIRQNSGTAFINRLGPDPDNASSSRGASTITLMEVAG